MRIYVASSWRNAFQPEVVRQLRLLGHEVYDFRNPPGRTGFSWSEIDPEWEKWTPTEFIEVMRTNPIASAGYNSDMAAIEACDLLILVLPSGRSASFEAGVAKGMEKPVIVFMPKACEPELMYWDCDIFSTWSEVVSALPQYDPGVRP